MNIYCSKKLESFLGRIGPSTIPTEPSNFGDWNGHLFTVDRKKCLIFMNNKTCYSIIMTNILKKDIQNFEQVFKNRLFTQLEYDLKLTEEQEIKLRKELTSIILVKSNNDRKIIGSMNHHVENLRFNDMEGGIDNWDEIELNNIINRWLMGTSIQVEKKRSGNYFVPIDLMSDLLKKR